MTNFNFENSGVDLPDDEHFVKYVITNSADGFQNANLQLSNVSLMDVARLMIQLINVIHKHTNESDVEIMTKVLLIKRMDELGNDENN